MEQPGNTQYSDLTLIRANNGFRITIRRNRRQMEENGELNLIRNSFVRKGNVLLSINHSIICFIESFIELGFVKCAYLCLIWSEKKILLRVGRIESFWGEGQHSYNIWCVNPRSLHSTLFRRENVFIPEHVISLLIFSSQFCVSCSQLWVVFPELFVPLFE